MILKTLLTAAAATALMVGAAQAGGPGKTDKDATTTGSMAASAPTTNDAVDTPSTNPEAAVNSDAAMSAPAAGADASASSSMASDGAMAAPSASSDASAVVSTSTVTNGPVADTAENRAKYGQPMSRAGKRTAPSGN